MEKLVCDFNIGPQQRRKRYVMGALMLGVGLVAGYALLLLPLDRYWRLLLFYPFAVGALGFFQAREKT